MDEEAKAFLIGIIACIIIAIMVLCSQYRDMRYVAQGYQWVPAVQGHWEKR